jgi:hypothetical protein
MTPFAVDLLVLLRRDLHGFIREVEAFPDDATLWRTVPGIRNSAGNLALHVAGNLRLLLGAVLGGTGYQRDREQELSQRAGSRAEVVAALEGAALELELGLKALTAESLAAPFPMAVGGLQPATGRFLVHLASHLAFHLGQAGYLRRALTGDATTTGAMAIKELVP